VRAYSKAGSDQYYATYRSTSDTTVHHPEFQVEEVLQAERLQVPVQLPPEEEEGTSE
jgi:hypothetical protein